MFAYSYNATRIVIYVNFFTLSFQAPPTLKKAKYPCSQCGSKFTRLNNLQRHIRDVHESELQLPTSVKCHICSAIIENESVLENHFQNTHQQSSEYVLIREAMQGAYKLVITCIIIINIIFIVIFCKIYIMLPIFDPVQQRSKYGRSYSTIVRRSQITFNWVVKQSSWFKWSGLKNQFI